MLQSFSHLDPDILKRSSNPMWPAMIHNICLLHATLRFRASLKSTWSYPEDIWKNDSSELLVRLHFFNLDIFYSFSKIAYHWLYFFGNWAEWLDIYTWIMYIFVFLIFQFLGLIFTCLMSSKHVWKLSSKCLLIFFSFKFIILHVELWECSLLIYIYIW